MRNPVTATTERYGYRIAKRVITNSDDVARAFANEPAIAAKAVTVYNAVDLSRYEDSDDRRLQIGSGSRPVVGFVGQIVPRKGVVTLLKAMSIVLRRLPDAWLVIVGCAPPGETDYEEECKRLAAELNLTDSVHWVGYRNDVPAWMRTFDVFALPTRSEPFGKVVIEAMAAGAPVVASRVGGIPEIIVSEDVGTLIPYDDPEALAEGILAYLVNPERAARVSAAGARSVRERFGLTEMLTRLQDLYDEVLDEARAVP